MLDTPLLLKDICSTHMVVALESTPFSDAVRQMRDARISALVIVRGKLPVGILTERDIVRLALDAVSIDSDRPVSELMSSPVITASAELEHHKGYHLLTTNKVRHLIVTDQSGALFGIVSESDFVQHLGIEYLLEVKTVDDVMKQSLVVCPPDTPLRDAIGQLIQFGISCLLIGSAERVDGIVTERDVVGYLVDDRLDQSLAVDQVMTSPVLSVQSGTSLDEARQLMNRNHIRRLLVIDQKASPVGIITRQSLIGGIEKRYVELLTDSYLRTTDALQTAQVKLAEQRYARVIEYLAGLMLRTQGDADQLLSAVIDELRKALDADRVWLLSPQLTGNDEIAVVHESCSEAWPSASAADDGVVARDPQLHEELQALLYRAEPITIVRRPGAVFESLYRRWQVKSALSVPIRIQDGPSWLLEVHDCRRERQWTGIEQNLLKDVSVHLTSALTNQRLLEQLEQDVRLRTSIERHLENLIDTVPHGILEIDRQGRVSFSNNACARIYGCCADDMPGTYLWQFDCEEKDADQLQQAFRRWMSGESTPVPLIRRQQRADGSLIWTSTHWNYRHNAAGETEGLIAVITDITAEQSSRIELKGQKDFLESILNGLPEALVIADSSRRIIRVNPALTTLFGYQEPELLGEKTAILYADVREFERQGEIRYNLRSAANHEPYLSHYRRHDGTIFPAETVGYPIRDGDGEFLGFVGVIRDLTSIEATKKARNDANLRLQLAARGAGIGIWDMHLDSDQLIWDEQMHRLYNVPPEEFSGDFCAWQQAVLPEDLARAKKEVEAALSGEAEFNTEFRIRWPDGQIRHIKAAATVQRDDAGAALRMVGANWDVTAERSAEATVRHQAYHDILTGLPNRILLQDRLQQVLAASTRSGRSGCLLFVDLDHFKNINDAYGHSMGDQLLVAVSRRIQRMLRDEDTFARLGGDEFVILLHEQQPAGVAAVCEKIMKLLEDPFTIEHHRFFVRASIGIAIFPGDGRDADTLLKHADAAMYKAKKQGRASWAFYDQELSRVARQRITLEQELLEALEQRQLQVFYQPQFRLGGDEKLRIIGAEALVRWFHPRLGMVPPDQFIPVAEEIGLVRNLDRYVLAEAIRQGRLWKKAGLLEGHIAVNVSLSTPDSLDYPEEIIAEFSRLNEEFADGLITLEITESHLMTNTGSSVPQLERLKRLNVRVSIDDFGTGYSSLSYLTRLPIDILKIDQSFVRDIEQDPNDRAIIRAILAMAEELQLDVVAEGVETEAQKAFLLENGCHFGQGYLVAKPMPAGELEGFIRGSAEAADAEADVSQPLS